MTTRYGVGSEFEDPESALQMGFQGQKSAMIFAGGVSLDTKIQSRKENFAQLAPSLAAG